MNICWSKISVRDFEARQSRIWLFGVLYIFRGVVLDWVALRLNQKIASLGTSSIRLQLRRGKGSMVCRSCKCYVYHVIKMCASGVYPRHSWSLDYLMSKDHGQSAVALTMNPYQSVSKSHSGLVDVIYCRITIIRTFSGPSKRSASAVRFCSYNHLL